MTPGPRPDRATRPAGPHDLPTAPRAAGARGSVGSRLEAGGAWGLWLAAEPYAALHVVVAGSLWLSVGADEPRLLRAGEAVWLPPGRAHGLAGRPGLPMGPCDRAAAESARREGSPMLLGQAPHTVRILTLHYARDREAGGIGPVDLDSPVQLSTASYPALAAVCHLLQDELSRPRVGTVSALNSVVDVLLVQFLRANAGLRPGVAGDPRLAPPLDVVVNEAVQMMHREPQKAWTAGNLARLLGVSRATLDRRFRVALGDTPSGYLTGCRMDLAAIRLRDTDEPVEAVGRSVGYTSPHAFSRAFSRSRGRSPRAYRQLVRLDPRAVEEPGA